MSNAYWISPRGQIIDVPTRHITNVLENPKQFGLDKPYIVNLYKKHKEPMGLEGKAREEIMILLMKGGWLRVRRSVNEWVIQSWALSDKGKNNIWDFVVHSMKKGIISKYTQITVQDVRNRNVVSSSATELAKSLFEGKKQRIKIKELLPQIK